MFKLIALITFCLLSSCASNPHDQRIPTERNQGAYGQFSSFKTKRSHVKIEYPTEMYSQQYNARFKTAKGWWFQ